MSAGVLLKKEERSLKQDHVAHLDVPNQVWKTWFYHFFIYSTTFRTRAPKCQDLVVTAGKWVESSVSPQNRSEASGRSQYAFHGANKIGNAKNFF